MCSQSISTGWPSAWADKAAKTLPVVATKALACKLAKAAWYLAARRREQAAA